MNYINHLTAVIERFSRDENLNSAHVSLYLALFYLWNMNRFKNPLSVNRSEVMTVSRIGSKTTYHKCLKELHEKGFIVYHPSHNPMKGSLIDLSKFGTSSETTCGTSTGQVVGQVLGQVLVPSINNTDPVNNPKNNSFTIPTIDEIKIFFQNNEEAEKFFNYYSANGWKVGGKTPMKDWQAAGRNWIMNSKKFNSAYAERSPRVESRGSRGEADRSTGLSSGNLNVNQNKDYTIPL